MGSSQTLIQRQTDPHFRHQNSLSLNETHSSLSDHLPPVFFFCHFTVFFFDERGNEEPCTHEGREIQIFLWWQQEGRSPSLSYCKMAALYCAEIYSDWIDTLQIQELFCEKKSFSSQSARWKCNIWHNSNLQTFYTLTFSSVQSFCSFCWLSETICSFSPLCLSHLSVVRLLCSPLFLLWRPPVVLISWQPSRDGVHWERLCVSTVRRQNLNMNM